MCWVNLLYRSTGTHDVMYHEEMQLFIRTHAGTPTPWPKITHIINRYWRRYSKYMRMQIAHQHWYTCTCTCTCAWHYMYCTCTVRRAHGTTCTCTMYLSAPSLLAGVSGMSLVIKMPALSTTWGLSLPPATLTPSPPEGPWWRGERVGGRRRKGGREMEGKWEDRAGGREGVN